MGDCPRSARQIPYVMLSLKNTSQAAAEKVGKSSVLEHREDPRVLHTAIGSGKVSKKDA